MRSRLKEVRQMFKDLGKHSQRVHTLHPVHEIDRPSTNTSDVYAAVKVFNL